jgi:glyoxylase-like metal-dependent hydrolase (beta-lactamase superfamily II)
MSGPSGIFRNSGRRPYSPGPQLLSSGRDYLESIPTSGSPRSVPRQRNGQAAPGHTELKILSDGTFKVDGGVMFGQVPKGQWQDWMPADRRNRIKLGLNCLLLRIGTQSFLVDTGTGGKHPLERRDDFGLVTPQLLSGLKANGLGVQDIDGVVLSSLRFEHTGGCTRVNRRGEVVPTFPQATYYVQREALEEATAPTERHVGDFIKDDFLPLLDRGRLHLVDGEHTIAPGFFVRRASGPTEGHQIAVITHGGERVAFLGDLVPTPFHLQLASISASDRHPEETLQTKREVLSEAVREGWLLIFSHGVTERAGYLENRGGRLYLRPITLE